MKLKDIPGLLGEKKNDAGVVLSYRLGEAIGYNQALDELGEKEIELDEKKIREIFGNLAKGRQVNDEEHKGHWRWAYEIDRYDLACVLAKADIIKVKEPER